MSRNFSNWIEAYQKYASFSESPDIFHFWTAISTIAGALRRHVWIYQGYFTWTSNFYIVFIAPPGIVSKSTTANIGMDLLRAVPGIRFGPDAVTWQSLVKSMASFTEGFDIDGTMHTMSPVTICSSEFGNFFKPEDGEMVNALVDLWDSKLGTWSKETKTQGNDAVMNPWINIIACATPAWIQNTFSQYMIGGGFTARTIFVYGDTKRRLVPYPGELLPENHEATKTKLIQDLENIAVNIVGEYKLSDAAHSWGVEWYLKDQAIKRSALDPFYNYYQRKQTHIHKLAMILAASESDSLIITPSHLAQALHHLDETEVLMRKVFENIISVDAKPAHMVKNAVFEHGAVNLKLLRQGVFKELSDDQIRAGLRACLEAGYIRSEVRGNQTFYVAVRETDNGTQLHS